MQVNVTQIQDKFVGESEKNIKHVFDEYRRLVKAMPVAPILLFNEADAIIGKRVLDDDTVRFLAQRYDYSGGQIENIARKLYIDNVLWNTGISKELLERFCDEECLSKPGKNTIKGFCA